MCFNFYLGIGSVLVAPGNSFFFPPRTSFLFYVDGSAESSSPSTVLAYEKSLWSDLSTSVVPPWVRRIRNGSSTHKSVVDFR